MTEVIAIDPFREKLLGVIELPGSKSVTNRALILGVLAPGPVKLRSPLIAEDSLVMMEVLRVLGFDIEVENNEVTIEGLNGRIPNGKASIFVGNAGTVARFIIPFLALKEDGEYIIDCALGMKTRPIKELLDSLIELGSIEVNYLEREGFLPIRVKTKGLKGGVLKLSGKSTSQFFSAMLLVQKFAAEKMSILVEGEIVSAPYVRMTKRMIEDFRDIFEYKIEGDASTASYFLGLVYILGGELKIKNFPREDGLQGDVEFLKVLNLSYKYEEGGLRVRKNGKIKENVFDFKDISDTFISLAAIAPLFEGAVEIKGIGHTRFKESNRVDGVCRELRKLGQVVHEFEDSIVIEPKEINRGITIETYNDHRMAMAFAVLGSFDLLKNGKSWLNIKNPACCVKTFPQYFEVLESLRNGK